MKNTQEDDPWIDQPGNDKSSKDDKPKLVIPAEFIALQVKNVIDVRKNFLRERRLPLDTVMDDPLIQEFLKQVKEEYHSRPDQIERQTQDKKNGKSVAAGKKQRWSRNLQRLAGSTQMWSFLSFSGRWEPKHLAELPPVQSNAPTAEQMQKTRVAVEARTRYRQGKALALHVEQKKRSREDYG